MKMIKPVVNLSKVAENYDTFILGFNGVLSNGNEILPEAATCLKNLFTVGKKVILLTNSPLRVASIASILSRAGISPMLFTCIMSAGEILHYRLKHAYGDYSAIGNTYFHLGNKSEKGVFADLDFKESNSLESSHFMYMSEVSSPSDTIDTYLPFLEHAAGLGIPFVCAGNDTSCFIDGKISLAPGALAEQYAVMGGRIITLGKPDAQIFNYCLDGIKESGSTLVVGDNVATDIKGAEILGFDSMLISKGIHVNYLGEGYIPDVAKTRELSNNYDASPNYVISNLRW